MFRPKLKIVALFILSAGAWYLFWILKWFMPKEASPVSLGTTNNAIQASSVIEKPYLKDKWLKLSPNVHIFSAYLDQRDKAIPHGEIQVMALVNESWLGPVYCVFMYRGKEQTVCSKKQPKKSILRVKQHHAPMMYSCRLPTNVSQIPMAVSLVFDNKCNNGRGQFTNVVSNERVSAVKEFGVCIHSPIFNMNDSQFVAESIEMNMLLGAELFTAYVESASVEVWSLLKSYHDQVDIVDWGTNLPSSRYKGQDISIQDCLYRNMYRVKYLVYTDLDELIFPVKHPDWHKMMQELDNARTGVFYFKHLAFFENKDDLNVTKIFRKHANCSRGDRAIRHMNVPRFLSFTLHTTKVHEKKRKPMLKPAAVRSLRVHRVLGTYDNLKSTTIDVAHAKMCHFRSNAFPGFRDSTVYFNKIQQFAPRLLDNLKKRLCNLR